MATSATNAVAGIMMSDCIVVWCVKRDGTAWIGLEANGIANSLVTESRDIMAFLVAGPVRVIANKPATGQQSGDGVAFVVNSHECDGVCDHGCFHGGVVWCGVVLRRATEENLAPRIPFDKKMFTKSENSFKPSHKRRKYKGLLRTRKARMTRKRAIPQGK